MNLTLVSMAYEDIAQWLATTRATYVSERIKAGDTLERANSNAAQAYTSAFPEGHPTASQRVFDVLLDNNKVGYLWLSPEDGTDCDRWWIYDIAIHPQFRGQGLGRRTMALAEDLAHRNGASALGLNVFGHNTTARKLYDSLGYDVSSIQMRKSLKRHLPEPS